MSDPCHSYPNKGSEKNDSLILKKPSPLGEGGEHSEPDRVLGKRERMT